MINNKNYLNIYKNKNLASFVVLSLFCCAIFWSCVKNDKLYSPEEGTIYMPQAYGDDATLSLYKSDTPQIVYFGAAYSGFGSATHPITALFQVDTSLIAQYNIDNAFFGYTYYALPDSSYTIDSLTTIMQNGSTSSVPLSLSIVTSKINWGTHYVLPIKLISTSSGKIDSALSIAYFKIDSVNIRAKDVTARASLSVNYENETATDTAETSYHLVDSNYTTNYLLHTYHADMYAQLKFPSSTIVTAYTLTSSNLGPVANDPKSWNLAASDDGNNWVIIDNESNVLFKDRSQTIRFITNNYHAYTYYRLNITENNNGNTGAFQCAEWRLQQFY